MAGNMIFCTYKHMSFNSWQKTFGNWPPRGWDRGEWKWGIKCQNKLFLLRVYEISKSEQKSYVCLWEYYYYPFLFLNYPPFPPHPRSEGSIHDVSMQMWIFYAVSKKKMFLVNRVNITTCWKKKKPYCNDIKHTLIWGLFKMQ